MSENKPGVVQINGVLIAGAHDALIELRNTFGSRHANHLILHVGEALVDTYPLLLSDMHPTDSSAHQVKTEVKVRMNVESSPRLVECYRSMGKGVRGMAMINLLNRLYMIGENDPQQVEAVVNERRRSASQLNDANQQVAAGAVERAPHRPMIEPVDKQVAGGDYPAQGVGDQAVETEEIVITDLPHGQDDRAENMLTADDDPLNNMGFQLFD